MEGRGRKACGGASRELLRLGSISRGIQFGREVIGLGAALEVGTDGEGLGAGPGSLGLWRLHCEKEGLLRWEGGGTKY